MNILVDENLPNMTVEALRAAGHRVLDLRGTPEEGIDDVELWQKVRQENSLLITTDKGFTEHRNESHRGILIIRLRQPNRMKIHERVMQAMAQFEPAAWTNLTVVMKDQVQAIYKGPEEEQPAL
jgi:predicted nuclease of predicted toxin-antitoxin system